MEEEQVDLSEDEVAEANSPGEAVCLTNNICIKAVAEVPTTIMVVVTIKAKVEDQTPTTIIITTSIITTRITEDPMGQTMKVLESIITTLQTTIVNHNGDYLPMATSRWTILQTQKRI